MSNTKRIVLTQGIVLAPEVDGEEGEVHEVSNHLAHMLVGSGSAVYHAEEGMLPATAVTRMEHPTNADPAPRRIASKPPKVKDKE
jgi:hypothetical protein